MWTTMEGRGPGRGGWWEKMFRQKDLHVGRLEEHESSLSKNRKSSSNQHVSPQSVPCTHGNVTNPPFLQRREWIGGYKVGCRETNVVASSIAQA